jgi:sulfatase maturation enzyme AslB (radical SAM superfamily)
MKRLRLVQLPVPQPAALASTGNVPLAAGYLAVSARVHGLEAKGLSLEVVAPDITDAYGDTALADYVAADEPELVGLSLYLWNVERSLHLAREIKRRSPRTQILIGGPEVGADNPFVLSQRGFDFAITGEAEDTFALVMQALLVDKPVKGIPGVAVRTPLGMSAFGPSPSAGFPLTAYPSPYLQGLVPVDAHRSTYVETVRGCRSHCAYCFYPRSSNVLRTLDVAKSAALIQTLRERGAREVVFLDPTFNHRPEFESLLEALCAVNHDKRLTFFGEIRAEGLTPKHARMLAAAGFTKLEIGLQSVNRETLKRVKRGGHPDKVAEAAHMLRSEGVDLLVDLMIGLPGDTEADVARGVDFLLQHDLGEHAQVFPLSLLPGTALRQSAAEDGVEFDPAPPYRVRRTATMDTDALRRALFDAEERLERRLDEQPRPHLVDPHPGRRDVFQVCLDTGAGLDDVGASGAQHVALWLTGKDLFGGRERAHSALDARLAVDPYAMLDVVLRAEAPFPLDLVDLLRRKLDSGAPSYASRALALRGEDLQRRISVVLPLGSRLPADFVDALRDVVPVYREQSAAQAAAHAAELGDTLPMARIMDEDVPQTLWAELAREADPVAVAFRNVACEAAWVRGVLE